MGAPNDDNTNDSIDECTKYTYTYCGNGRLYFNNNEIKTIDDCEDGTVLELILFESSLNMRLNEKEQILLFDDIIPTKYRFAISLCYAEDQCVILEQNIADNNEQEEDENIDLVEKNEKNEAEGGENKAVEEAKIIQNKSEEQSMLDQPPSNQSAACCVVL